MHYQCEIVLPAGTDDIVAAVESVMKPFNEGSEESDGYGFWDFYVIGGRFAGRKQLAKYDKEKLQEFYNWLDAEKVTVASFVSGKQELQPASQISKVDAKWNELFPSSGGVMVACPIFKHSNDQYAGGLDATIQGDVSILSESKDVTCSRVIFSGPSYSDSTGSRTGPLEAVFMLAKDHWNGVNHMEIMWDGTIGDALRQFDAKLARMNPEYAKLMQPTDDSLVVTVDYHS